LRRGHVGAPSGAVPTSARRKKRKNKSPAGTRKIKKKHNQKKGSGQKKSF